MWQDHGQLCNVEICSIWNSFLSSTLLCELRGYDWQWSRGLNHILNLPKEDLLGFLLVTRHWARAHLQGIATVWRAYIPVQDFVKGYLKYKIDYRWPVVLIMYSWWQFRGDKKAMVPGVCHQRLRFQPESRRPYRIWTTQCKGRTF